MSDPLGPTLDQTALVAGNVYAWLAHPAWLTFWEPEFRHARDIANAFLLNPVASARGGYSDDYLRARVNVIDELLTMGQRFLNDYEAARQQAEEAEESQDLALYDARADLGHVGPLNLD
jgi:hypothetical protein